jgi:hypothetical protein
MSTSDPWPVAIKDAPRSNHEFVSYLLKVALGLNNHIAIFTNPVPTAADLQKAAVDLSAANAKAKHGTPADTADRDAQRLVGDELADRLVLYVRATVRAQAASASEAANMILGVGLAIKTVPTRTKAELAAKYDRVSGDVHLVARAVAADAVYLWEWSLDQKSWNSIPQTMVANTTVSNLAPGQVYAFRFHAQTRKGMGDYSMVVTLSLH